MSFMQTVQFVIGYFAVAGVATIAQLDYSIGSKTKKTDKEKKED